jgi:hypothetical protein
MGVPDRSRGKRGKEPGMEDAPDIILIAEIRPEHTVGAAFRKDLVKKYVSLEAYIIAHKRSTCDNVISG